METEAYVNEIEDWICTFGTISFAEIERKYPKLFGDNIAVSHSKLRENNIYLWFSFNEQGAEVFARLMKRNKIIPTPTTPFVYAMDGLFPAYKVAKSYRKKYKTVHWAPVVFSKRKDL